MRKFKGFIPTTALLVTMAFGTTFANAGIIISDKAGTPDPSCKGYELGLGDIVTAVAGIIISDKAGIIISDKTGLIISDAVGKGCPADLEKDGIIISD